MPKMTYEQIKAKVQAYVDATKIAGAWNATTNNLVGLLDKIAKTVTVDGVFADKLQELDGEELPLGKTIEEWYAALCTITDYNDYIADDSTAAQDALKPYYPEYENPSYSYSLGRKKIPTTVKYDEYERASINPQVAVELVSYVLKRLYDTFGQFKYNAKKEIIAKFIAKCESVASTTGATAYVNATTDIVKGTRYYQSTNVGICKQSKTHATGDTWASLIAGGYIVQYDLINVLAKPTDTATGEAFVKQVKADVETAQFVTEGHSINGNTVGAETGLILFVNKSIMPTLDVDVLAGAFNQEKLALPCKIKVIDDFGSNATSVYAVLTDSRSMRLHPDYMAVREQPNGAGDYMNYFLHTENTAYYSNNTFVKVYKPA